LAAISPPMQRPAVRPKTAEASNAKPPTAIASEAATQVMTEAKIPPQPSLEKYVCSSLTSGQHFCRGFANSGPAKNAKNQGLILKADRLFLMEEKWL